MEELGAASGTLWLHCDFCGHFWRQLAPEADPFSLIVAGGATRAEPITEAPTTPTAAVRVDRALRFTVHLAMRYRPHGDSEWRPATTENVSRSGVLFRTDETIDPDTPIDLLLTLPGAVSGEPASRLRCTGRVVRTTTCHAPEARPCLAAAVADYRLVV